MKNGNTSMLSSAFCSAIAVTFVLLMLIYPSAATSGATKGLILCAQIIIPSLFPVCAIVLFIFSCGLQELISKIGGGKFRNFTDLFLIFLASFTGGYPVGAIMISEAYNEKRLNKKDAEKLLFSCVNAGPAFIILAVGGGIFNSPKIGRLLFISSAISSIIIFIATFPFNKKAADMPQPTEKINIYDSFVNSVYKATTSVLSICGYVVLYSAAAGVLMSLPDRFGIIKTVLPFLEVTNGVVLINKNPIIAAFLIGFGGICVHFQVLSNSSVFGPSLIKFELSRIIHGTLNAAVFMIILKVLGIALPTISNGVSFTGKAFYLSLAEGIALCLLSVALIFSLKDKISGRKNSGFMLKYMR